MEKVIYFQIRRESRFGSELKFDVNRKVKKCQKINRIYRKIIGKIE